MKVLFNHNIHDSSEEWSVNLGIGWFKHAPTETKKFKSWKGLTIIFYCIRWQFHITWVNDYKAYRTRMDYCSTYTGHLRDKK